MQYCEITFTILLMETVNFLSANELIAKNLNRALFLDPELSRKHEENAVKHYVYSSFFPAEAGGDYQKGRIYTFRVRSLDEIFIHKLQKLLPIAAVDFKVVASQIKIQKYRFITKLRTITPALATLGDRYWVPENDLELLQERIQNNLLKKYRTFFNESLSPKESFIQHLEVLNRKPIALKFKKTQLIANKFDILVKEDEVSQKIAFMAMACGVLEKNGSCGLGFCAAK